MHFGVLFFTGWSAKANRTVLLCRNLWTWSTHGVCILKAIDQKRSLQLNWCCKVRCVRAVKRFWHCKLHYFIYYMNCSVFTALFILLTTFCWAKWFRAEELPHNTCQLKQKGKYLCSRLCCIPFFHSQFVEGSLRAHYSRLVLSDKTVGKLPLLTKLCYLQSW